MHNPPPPYLNGPRHTFLNLSVKNVPPRILSRLVDRAMGRNSSAYNLEPPFLALQSAIPNIHSPHVDVTRAKVAFGKWALPKLRRELHHSDKFVVRQAANSIFDMVHDPEKTFEAINLNIIARIEDLLVSDEPFLRERCAGIMKIIAGQELGREAIIKDKVAVENLAILLRDPVPGVRLNASCAVEMLTRSWVCADAMNDAWFVPLLVARLSEEDEDLVIETHLQTLQYLLDRDSKKVAIELGTIDILQQLIDNPNTGICSGALACLELLMVHRDGKQIAIEIDLLLKLREKLFDDRQEVHTKAAGAMMEITQTTPSKLRALELDIIDRLLLLAADFHCQELQMNCVKVLTNIAEVPHGRAILLNFQSDIEAIRTGRLENLERSIAILLSIIRWKP